MQLLVQQSTHGSLTRINLEVLAHLQVKHILKWNKRLITRRQLTALSNSLFSSMLVMQIKKPNNPTTKYSIKVLKSQSINSNYLSQLEACFALSVTNKLCLTVQWLFQSGYKGECYLGAALLEGVLVNVCIFPTSSPPFQTAADLDKW